jgi:hypothetical protein
MSVDAASPYVPFKPWFDARFRKPDGKPFSRRTRQKIVKKYGLPVHREGWAELISPEQGERKLREAFGDASSTPPRRGRRPTRVE